MRILLAGVSGFLGTALREHLIDHGFSCRQLVRREPELTDELAWDPYASQPQLELQRAVSESNAVINLAGAPLSRFPWTRSYRRTIFDSRVHPTRTLADAVAAAPAPVTLVNASAIGIYGTGHGDDVITEETETGHGFLAGVARRWERAAAHAGDNRVVMLRTGIALGPDGGALGALGKPLRLGLGGKVGDGQWWMSTISRLDFCRAVVHLLFSELSGPVNVTGPEPVRNAEFAAALQRQMHRRALVRMPRRVVCTLGRTMAQEVLTSQRVVPQRLLDDGFVFAEPTIDDQLATALARSDPA